MSRVITKIGDVFSVNVDEESKKYFQLVAVDSLQLNSDVLRIFKTKYSTNASPDLLDIVKDEVDLYAHCMTKIGLKMKLFEKVGNIKEIGSVSNIIFRHTNDYGSKVGKEKIKVSNNWFVWCINDNDFKPLGKLGNLNQKSYIGLVFNPLGIIELMKGNKYPIYYPT